MTKQTEALATVEHAFPVFANKTALATFQQNMRENFGEKGLTPQIVDQVKVPAGGGTFFEVNTTAGVDSRDKLTGTILLRIPHRELWGGTVGDGSMPLCSSSDMTHGNGAPGGRCVSCQYNKWGSAKDDQGNKRRGKACSERCDIYLLLSGEMLPIRINLPVMSVAAVDSFAYSAMREGKSILQSVVNLSLVKKTNKENTAYSEVVLGVERPLDPEEVEGARKYVDVLQQTLNTQRSSSDSPADAKSQPEDPNDDQDVL